MLRYEETPPPEPLRPLVHSLWAFSVPADWPASTHYIPPDGCFSLATVPEAPHIVLVGPHPGPLAVFIGPNYCVRGVRLRPEAGRCLLATPPKSWVGQIVPIETVMPTLAARIPLHTSIEARFDALLDSLLALLPMLPSSDEQIQRAVAAIEAARGDVRIDALASALGMSRRTLQRRFLAATGLPPKTYARVRRFLLAAGSNVLRSEPEAWGRVAAEHGFADQAHFTRECAELTGVPPTTFAARQHKIEHVDVQP